MVRLSLCRTCHLIFSPGIRILSRRTCKPIFSRISIRTSSLIHLTSLCCPITLSDTPTRRRRCHNPSLSLSLSPILNNPPPHNPNQPKLYPASNSCAPPCSHWLTYDLLSTSLSARVLLTLVPVQDDNFIDQVYDSYMKQIAAARRP